MWCDSSLASPFLYLAAYLFVILPPSKPSTPLFQQHVELNIPDRDEAYTVEAKANSHEAYGLSDVYAIPLEIHSADEAFQFLEDLQVSPIGKVMV